jgi:UDP-N-acetylmuramoyl-L-alanyl-D-glutamate--2,6-diaminopimelate ligase
MRLGDLAGVGSDAQVTGFAIDHRKVAPGTVFGAFRGSMFNGEDFIPSAVGAGAVAVVARPGCEGGRGGSPQLGRASARVRAAWLPASSSRFRSTVIAVTGTNGKTSNVELTRQLWRMAGFHAASIGTLE